MKKTVGIIGGMGPAATADLFNLIISNTKASCDQEHIHVIIDCNTKIPDRTAAILEGAPSPLEELCSSAKRLSIAGADFIVIPCNTSHYFLPEIREAVSIPVVDMIEETAKSIKSSGNQRAIVLCTEGTKKSGVYTTRLAMQGIEAIYPDPELQREVNRVIYDGIKKGATHFDISNFNILLEKTIKDTAAVAVLACTELPVAKERYGMRGQFINPTMILAKATIQLAGYQII